MKGNESGGDCHGDSIPVLRHAVLRHVELKSLKEKVTYERYSNDIAWLVASGAVVPIEVKSGKSYKRHVALNNLFSLRGNTASTARTCCPRQTSQWETREGKPVAYLPLYMLLFVAKEFVAENTGIRDELSRMGASPGGLVMVPPDFSDYA